MMGAMEVLPAVGASSTTVTGTSSASVTRSSTALLMATVASSVAGESDNVFNHTQFFGPSSVKGMLGASAT